MNPRPRATGATLAAIALLTASFAITLGAQFIPDLPRPVETLRGRVPPEPPNLGEFVKDRQAALVLGKALFWDMQAGSDEQTACATCHFAAGADARVRNRFQPGIDAFNRTLSTTSLPATTAPTGPNYTLTEEDYPFHVLADPDDRESAIVFGSNDVVGSQGVFELTFNGFDASGNEKLTLGQSTVFRVGASPNRAQVRKVTGRQAPTVINSAFNHRNFWDGRANHVFNGVNPFGPRDPGAVVWVNDGTATCVTLLPQRIALVNAAPASQAVGPPLSTVEMSANKRTFPDIGRKLLTRRALALQRVDPTDSVLGPYVHASGLGLNLTYRQLVELAFQPKYWNSTAKVPRTTYSQMEGNFSLFWGLAIQIYESTLISDDAPIDRYLTGDTGALTADQVAGMAVFTGRGACGNCHNGPEFTSAARLQHLNAQVGGLVERMLMGNFVVGLYDSGFYNIGVTPTANDILLGAGDPYSQPLSFTRQIKLALQGGTAADVFTVNTCTFEFGACQPFVDPASRDAVDGSAKTPTLRNVELTGPYFHNGSYLTLEQVVEFYDRGGNVRKTATGDTSGYGANASNFAFDIQPLGLTEDEQRQLVAFLKALTDPRVRDESAPFDHPELLAPDGHPGDPSSTPVDGSGRAIDRWVTIPAVGAVGRPAANPPLPPVEAWAPPSASVPVKGLVAAYSFNDAVVKDLSVKENDGSIGTATWTAAGKYGGALSFDGNDMATINSSASLAVTNRFTLEAWVNPAALGGWRTVMVKEKPLAGVPMLAFALYADAGTDGASPGAYFNNGQDMSVIGTSPVPIGQWTHLAATYDGASFTLFVNGVQVRSVPRSGTVVATALPLRIGGNSTWTDEYFQGRIDEVRIYNRALTQAEIAADMGTPLP